MRWLHGELLSVQHTPGVGREGPSAPDLARAGEHFVAALGCQQSVLEGVLLKRRVMGPSWLSLARPVRTDVGQQARAKPYSHQNPTHHKHLPRPMPCMQLLRLQHACDVL